MGIVLVAVGCLLAHRGPLPYTSFCIGPEPSNPPIPTRSIRSVEGLMMVLLGSSMMGLTGGTVMRVGLVTPSVPQKSRPSPIRPMALKAWWMTTNPTAISP